MVVRRAIASTSIYVLLIALGLFFLIPLAWPVLGSLNTSATLAVTWPKEVSLTNFITIIANGLVLEPFANSAIMAITTMVLVSLLAGLAAYPLSRYQFRFKAPLMYMILFTSALPILALVTPLYAMFVSLNLVDTLQGCILFFVASGLPFSIWLMKNFIDSVPVELEEAAWIDGASIWGSFLYVLLPMVAPGLAVVGVWSFLGAWTNFFIPLIILQSPELLPASVHIYTFFGSYGQVNYGQLAAYAMLYSLPAVALYTLVSRFFVRGMSGGLKG
ncbi:carbohydrate ABC transporter permease [Ktedonosporobacter rubrisoli]|uniref:Carbohydrate ABC transporter permease n=1 Tax=Ktedonosporobacter rubrisoli TaxID=2509675 RepID=A0A4P6K270_KTERU|nr:carbohydrate ABC transporter permease [Ktedonosporobacter rubrisoli]QBD81800.1 carbohydrate ABC transporter permease [Ktedonosporobacter rubrisoli]